jgi:hypothetical protein
VRKFISTLLIATCIASPTAATNLHAAQLGELLGARHHASAPANPGLGAQQPGTPAQDFQSVDARRRGTVRFPILSKVIKLVIFILLRSKK